MATHTNISDADLGSLSSTHLHRASRIEIDHVDSLGGRLGHRLNNDVVEAEFVDLIIQQVQLTTIITVEYILEGVLADFALEIFPDVRVYDSCLLAVTLTI